MQKDTYSWLNPKLEIRKHQSLGRGVFAIDDIKRGETLVVMGGHICNTEQENEIGELATEYNMDISEEWSFCPTNEEDIEKMPQHLINHSCEPNCGFTEQCFITAIKDIRKDSEIVYDYAFVMYSANESDYHFSIDCKCNTTTCRKKITEDDWKNRELQEKYGEYFQPFLRKKFK